MRQRRYIPGSYVFDPIFYRQEALAHLRRAMNERSPIVVAYKAAAERERARWVSWRKSEVTSL